MWFWVTVRSCPCGVGVHLVSGGGQFTGSPASFTHARRLSAWRLIVVACARRVFQGGWDGGPTPGASPTMAAVIPVTPGCLGIGVGDLSLLCACHYL